MNKIGQHQTRSSDTLNKIKLTEWRRTGYSVELSDSWKYGKHIVCEAPENLYEEDFKKSSKHERQNFEIL